MSEGYYPASEFLRSIIAEEVPLFGSEMAEHNFKRLIALTRDEDRSNRDWAAMLLSQQDIDTAEVREALLCAAADEDADVRAEAICGLARRDPAIALPFIREALISDRVGYGVFEAAALVADSSLVDHLRSFADPSDDPFVDDAVLRALAACESGVPRD
ncbi:hypothetical protein ACFB49_35370 [Sphingomonas sp. DBB INV C78]|uniref:HEAT repeat domain-containing protein n=1 Tax=Sphingomonas sp. DBB INV C78 TaxID=3349434 RepID=UPI0036D3F449